MDMHQNATGHTASTAGVGDAHPPCPIMYHILLRHPKRSAGLSTAHFHHRSSAAPSGEQWARGIWPAAGTHQLHTSLSAVDQVRGHLEVSRLHVCCALILVRGFWNPGPQSPRNLHEGSTRLEDGWRLFAIVPTPLDLRRRWRQGGPPGSFRHGLQPHPACSAWACLALAGACAPGM